jgi:hypothetical protein
MANIEVSIKIDMKPTDAERRSCLNSYSPKSPRMPPSPPNPEIKRVVPTFEDA